VSAAVAAAFAVLAAIMSALAYALGRKQAPPAPKPEDAPHDAIKGLDAAIDRVAATPTDVLARHLAERARARERAIGGDPPVRD
jgi:hypothetical protein